jgi:hypothetical protein
MGFIFCYPPDVCSMHYFFIVYVYYKIYTSHNNLSLNIVIFTTVTYLIESVH